MADNLVAKFSLNNKNLQAKFNINETSIPAIFKINSCLDVIGEGVINVTKTDGKAIIASKTYIHEQGISSDTWVIEHNLDKYPSVAVVDTAGTVFTAEVEYNNKNTCTVYINGATKGKAYLN